MEQVNTMNGFIRLNNETEVTVSVRQGSSNAVEINCIFPTTKGTKSQTAEITQSTVKNTSPSPGSRLLEAIGLANLFDAFYANCLDWVGCVTRLPSHATLCAKLFAALVIVLGAGAGGFSIGRSTSDCLVGTWMPASQMPVEALLSEAPSPVSSDLASNSPTPIVKDNDVCAGVTQLVLPIGGNRSVTSSTHDAVFDVVAPSCGTLVREAPGGVWFDVTVDADDMPLVDAYFEVATLGEDARLRLFVFAGEKCDDLTCLVDGEAFGSVRVRTEDKRLFLLVEHVDWSFSSEPVTFDLSVSLRRI